MKFHNKFLVTLVLLLFSLSMISPVYATLTVSSSTQTFGFNNGSYLGFANPMVFLTSVDGGQTQQVASSNASYPDFMFFQQQGSDAYYGFHLSGLNATVNTFFAGSLLELATTGAGTIKVYTGALGQPTLVSGASGTYSSLLGVATVLTSASGTVQLSWAGITPPVGGGTVPEPTNAMQPPLGSNDFQINDVSLGSVVQNGTYEAVLSFRFSGSSYTLNSIVFSEPFNSWFDASSFQQTTHILNSVATSNGQTTLRFTIPSYVANSDYEGGVSVSAYDVFHQLHTSSAKISATVNSEVEEESNFALWIRENLLFVGVLVTIVLVALGAAAAFSKRR